MLICVGRNIYCLNGLRKRPEFLFDKIYTIEHSITDVGLSQLSDCLLLKDETGSCNLHLLFLSISKTRGCTQKDSSTESKYATYLDWVSYVSKDESTWEMIRHRTFQSSFYPEFVSFECQAKAVNICSQAKFLLQYDSNNPNAVQVDDDNDLSHHEFVSSISWSQDKSETDDDSALVTISIQLDSNIHISSDQSNPAVQIELSPLNRCANQTQVQTIHIQLLVDNLDDTSSLVTLLHQPLYGLVRTSPVWTLDRPTGCLEVNLTKDQAQVWPRLLYDYSADRALIQCLSNGNHSIADNEVVPPDGVRFPTSTEPSFNVGQLEDVDYPTEEDEPDLILERFDAERLRVTHRANLSGHQWICKIDCVHPISTTTSSFCLRYDVDGTVWLPKSDCQDPNLWQHVGTFQAFGYVLASKRDRRFVACPLLDPAKPIPFVAVADTIRHVYIYHQPVRSGHPRNRDMELKRRWSSANNNETTVVHTAWQQVVSLPINDMIIGFVAVEKPYLACVVCTKSNFYLISLEG